MASKKAVTTSTKQAIPQYVSPYAVRTPTAQELQPYKTLKVKTVATVNAALRALGYDERLTKGNGYYYFREGKAMFWYTSSLYWFDLSGVTVAEVILEMVALSQK